MLTRNQIPDQKVKHAATSFQHSFSVSRLPQYHTLRAICICTPRLARNFRRDAARSGAHAPTETTMSTYRAGAHTALRDRLNSIM